MKKEILTPSHKYWRALRTRLCHMLITSAEGRCQGDVRHTKKILKSLPNINVEESLILYRELGVRCDCGVLYKVEEDWNKN